MTTRERARPMAPEDRRAALIRAAIPLLAERGRDVSTKEIAEAAGVAEGTLFRAFGDKESLIGAAMNTFLDPRPLRDAIDRIDRSLPVETKLRRVLELLRERFTGVMGFMSALGLRNGPPPRRADDVDWTDVLAGVLESNQQELAVPPRTIARYLRVVALASSVPQLGGQAPLGGDELLDLVAHGVLRAGREG